MSDERLKQLIDAVINNNDETAETAFHSFLGDKMKAVLELQRQAQATDLPGSTGDDE